MVGRHKFLYVIIFPSRCFLDNDQSSMIFFRGSINYFSSTVKTLYLIRNVSWIMNRTTGGLFDTTGLDSDQNTARLAILSHVSSSGVD